MVLEFLPGGDLEKLIMRCGKLGKKAVRYVWCTNNITRLQKIYSESDQFDLILLNPFPFEWVLRALIDFTLSNARRFYSSMGNLLDGKGLTSRCFPLRLSRTYPFVKLGPSFVFRLFLWLRLHNCFSLLLEYIVNNAHLTFIFCILHHKRCCSWAKV